MFKTKLIGLFIALSFICSPTYAQYYPAAEQIETDTADFDNNLGVGDTTVQKALETLDEIVVVGESNTASNTGSLGTGLFKQKTDVDLEFYKIASANARLAVALEGTDYLKLTPDTDLHNYSWANVIDADIPNAITVTDYMEDEDINTFAELQTWITDEVLLKAGTLTNAKFCKYDSAAGTIVCNYDEADPNVDEAAEILAIIDNTALDFGTGVITAAGFAGPLTGEASTASALAANGANCNTGNAPLGVDAAGAVESCFDVWTESENTSAGYISATLTQEEVDDYVYALISDADSVHTRITITYDDTDNAYDFIVDDMNDVAVTLAVDAEVLLGLSTQELGLDSQDANLIFAGPITGGAADPTFRSLVDNDIPDDITITEVDPNALLTAGTDNVKDTHIDWGFGANQVGSDDIPILELDTATYDNVQDWINNTQSVGYISGGEITKNDPEDGAVDIAAGTGFIKITNSDIGITKSFDWAAKPNLVLTDENINYIYINYNTETEAITVATITDFTSLNFATQFPLATAFRRGTVTEIIPISGVYLPNYLSHQWHRLEHRGIERMSGSTFSETGTRGLNLTAGVYYNSFNEITTTAQTPVTFFVVYRDGGTGWTYVGGQTQVTNTLYDDGTGTPGTITDKKYGVYWVYQCMEGDIYIQYGQDQALDLDDAQAVSFPVPPNYLSEFAVLRAKIIIEEEEDVFTELINADGNLFVPTATSVHNELAGLQGGTVGEYYHLVSAEYTELNAWLDDVTLGSSGTLTIPTGQNFLIGTTQWNSADEFDGTKIKDADYGDVIIDADGDWDVVNAQTVTTELDPSVDTDDKIIAIINASPSTQIKHEAGGLEADVNAYSGLVGINEGSTTEVDTEGELETHLGGLDVVTVTADDITSANLASLIDGETGTGDPVFSTSPTLITPALGTIASGVGTALTALDGENIQNATIDQDAIDFGSITGADLTLTDAGTITSSGIVTGTGFTIADPGVGNLSTIDFVKTNDHARIYVKEYGADATSFTFYMDDNPDSADDYFNWYIDNWVGNGGAWMPLLFRDMKAEINAARIDMRGNVYLGVAPYYAAEDVTLSYFVNIDGLPYKNEAGTLVLTPNASGYTTSDDTRTYWIEIDGNGSPNTFEWGTGNLNANVEDAGVAITGSAQTLDNGVTITFNATTGGVIGDDWQFTAFSGGLTTTGALTVTSTKAFKLGANRIDNGSDLLDGAMIADDTIDSDEYAAASIDSEHIAALNITEDLLAASLVFDDGDLLDFGTFVTGATEGIMLPSHATDCTSATAEGQVCWEEDAKKLYVGDGAAAVAVGPGAAVETNSLEVVTTGIATTEIPIGTAADTVVYAALSGEATMDNAGAVTLADSVTVTSWNLTTPTLTTSATVSDAFTFGLGAGKGLIQFDDETVDFISLMNAYVGIGTATPNAPLEVRDDFQGVVGGFASGILHITNKGTDANDNAVITGHNAYNTNKQLWYLGSTSNINDDIAFINRQSGNLFFYTDNTNRITIDAVGNVNIVGLTASEIVITDASKNLVSAAVATYPSLAELAYVKGLESAVQTQINAKAPSDAPTFTTSFTATGLVGDEDLQSEDFGEFTCAGEDACTLDDGVTVDTWALGDSTATTINKITITPPASAATLTIVDGKTLTATNTVNINTLTDGKWCKYTAAGTVLNCDQNAPATDEVGTLTTGDMCTNDGTLVQCTVNTEAELETAMDALDIVTVTADDITSANLATLINGETGTGDPVFSTSPTFVTQITVPSIKASTDLALVDDTTGDIHIFQTGTVADAADGKSVYFHRNSVSEGDGYVQIFTDQYDVQNIYGDRELSIQAGGSALRLNETASGDIDLFDNSASGENRNLTQYGYITNGASKRYINWQINDATDNFELTRSNAVILGLDIQMPLITDSILVSGLTASEIVITDASSNLVSAAVATYPSLTELSYVKGLSSAIQTQLGNKAPTTAPTFATSITGSYLTASEMLITGASKEIISAPVATYPSLTELSYVKGLSSAIQTQLGNKAPSDSPTFTTDFTATGLIGDEDLQSEDFGEFTCAGEDACTIDDSVAVTSWNLTTPIVTTSIDLPASAINTATEIAADIITHTQILDADQMDTKCILIETPADADDFLWFRSDDAYTVTSIDGICEAATSAIVVINECDSAGDNCGAGNTKLEESITVDVDGQADDGTLGNPGIAAGNWLRAQVGTVTGTPGHVTVCASFTYDD